LQKIGRKREAFLDRKPGACPRRARDRRVGPPGAQCLWIFTPVIDPFSWEWSVGEKTEGYSTKQLKGRANECHSGGTEDTTRHASRAALPNTKTATSLRHRTVIGAELRKHGCRGHSQPRGVPNRAWLSHSLEIASLVVGRQSRGARRPPLRRHSSSNCYLFSGFFILITAKTELHIIIRDT
jgi:hypothetical protein